MRAGSGKVGWILWMAALMGTGVAIWTVATYQPTPEERQAFEQERYDAERRVARAVSGGERRVRRLLNEGRVQDALESARIWASERPESAVACYWVAYLAGQLDDQAMSRRVAERGLRLLPLKSEDNQPLHWNVMYYKGWFERLLGDEPAALASFDALVTLFDASAAPEERDAGWWYNAACYAALRGDHDAAIAHLDTALRNGWDDHNWAMIDPDFDVLRHDPRFAAVFTRRAPALGQAPSRGNARMSGRIEGETGPFGPITVPASEGGG